jgi:hypothetical protein
MTKSKHALSMTALVIVSLQLLFLALTTSLLSPASELSTSNQVRSPSTLRVTPRLLHDKTLDWDPAVRRAWLDPTIPHKPPAMLLLTNFGWNHPNQTYGKQVYRNIRTRELVNGIINHPWFHPTAFQDLQEGTMQLNNSTRYYIFLDKHSCGEKNYPIYGKGLEGVRHNRDTRHGRGNCCIDQKNHYTKQVMESKVMQAQSATFILFECSGIGPKLKPEFKRDRQSFPGKKLAFISLSAIHPHLIPDHDQGLVPPALQPCDESILEPEPVCHRRPILLSFAGKISRSIARLDLETINNDQDIMVGGHEKAPKWMKMPLQELGKAFRKLASLSDFGAAPRGKWLNYTFLRLINFLQLMASFDKIGDNLFSYRLTGKLTRYPFSFQYSSTVYSDGMLNY